MTTKLAPLFVLFMGCVTTPDEGVTAQAIVGGTRVTTTDYPTVVALQQNGEWFCTGTLVDKDWVLTAASCFDSTAATQVRLGDADLTDGTTAGTTINVTEIRKHPQFSDSDTVWRHDVALLKLSAEVVERIVWEVVPDLAEQIIRENLHDLTARRS